jgi:hypothetical protein
MILPNTPSDTQEFLDALAGYKPTYQDKYLEWEVIRSKAVVQMERMEECLLRVEEFKRRMGHRFGDGPYGRLGRELCVVTLLARNFRKLLAVVPDFSEIGDDERDRLGKGLRIDTGLAEYNVDQINEMLDAPLTSFLDRLQVVRYEVGCALSSFARRFVPRARGTVVPFDGPS